jgi:hypothetical protein
MTDVDDRLKTLFTADEPPARDPAFCAAIMEKVIRRRFQADVALLSAASVAGAGVLWGLWPVVQPVAVAVAQGMAPAAAALSVALCVAAMMGDRPGSALGLET